MTNARTNASMPRRAPMRDVLTGEMVIDINPQNRPVRIRPELPIRIWRDYDSSREPWLQEAIPIKRERLAPYPHNGTRSRDAKNVRGYEGGQAWTHEWERYIGKVVPTLAIEERQHWYHWWEVEYVRECLMRHFDIDLVLAVCAWLSDEPDIVRVGKRFKVHPRAIRAGKRQMVRFVRANLLPYDRPRSPRPEAQAVGA